MVAEVSDIAKTILRKEIAIDNPWPEDRGVSTWNAIVAAAKQKGVDGDNALQLLQNDSREKERAISYVSLTLFN